jgi:phytoene synthase
MFKKYDSLAIKTSRLVTNSYSTSFSIGISALNKKYRNAVYAIYAYVRLADEIVDTFHECDKNELLIKFEKDTWEAIETRMSINPVLYSFQKTVNIYGIERILIETFLESMKMDLDSKSHSRESYNAYILGSAEVVGLMCLQVFCNGNKSEYYRLREYAMSLGSAFQKINFLRDLQSDRSELGRVYFPDLELDKFDNTVKNELEEEISCDFRKGYEGIIQLPLSCRLGVLISYLYYSAILMKIKEMSASDLLKTRVRISNGKKLLLLCKGYLLVKFKLLK